MQSYAQQDLSGNHTDRESSYLSEDLAWEISYLQESICLDWEELSCCQLRILWICDFDVNAQCRIYKILRVEFCRFAHPLLIILTFTAVTIWFLSVCKKSQYVSQTSL